MHYISTGVLKYVTSSTCACSYKLDDYDYDPQLIPHQKNILPPGCRHYDRWFSCLPFLHRTFLLHRVVQDQWPECLTFVQKWNTVVRRTALGCVQAIWRIAIKVCRLLSTRTRGILGNCCWTCRLVKQVDGIVYKYSCCRATSKLYGEFQLSRPTAWVFLFF